jgi:hypothetical protein
MNLKKAAIEFAVAALATLVAYVIVNVVLTVISEYF